MARYYANKNRYAKGFKECQRFKSTACGSGGDNKRCVITCVYKRQRIERVKEYGVKIKEGGVYSGWSIKFEWFAI